MKLLTMGSIAALPLKLYSFVSSYLTNWDLVFGATFLVTLPIILIFISMQRMLIRGAVSGFVKG